MQSKIMEREQKLVAVTKVENPEQERNKKIIMNNNNILFKSNLNPLAKEFTPLNIMRKHRYILNPLAKVFTPLKKKNNEIKNSVIKINTSPENAKEFTLLIPIKHKPENHVMDVNINLESVSKQFLQKYMEQVVAWYHKGVKNSLLQSNIILTHNCITKPFAKKFNLSIQIKHKTENHVMDININLENVSKQVLEKYMRQMDWNQKTVKNISPQNIIQPHKGILKPLDQKLTPIQESYENENQVVDVNSSPEKEEINQSKELNEIDTEQDPSNHNIEENPSEEHFVPRRKAKFIIRLRKYCSKKMQKLFHSISRIF